MHYIGKDDKIYIIKMLLTKYKLMDKIILSARGLSWKLLNQFTRAQNNAFIKA